MDKGKYSEQHEVTFSEKRWHEKILDFIKFLPHEVPVFIAVSISLWGFSEIVNGAFGERLGAAQFAAPILCVGLVVALTRGIYRYWAFVPTPLQLESLATQKIYKKQKCGWQFDMTRQMLSERLSKTELSLERIQRGAEFVEPKILEMDQYFSWLRGRPIAFIRLTRSISVICTTDLPKALSSPGAEKFLPVLIAEVDALTALYEKLKFQELSCYEVEPPESFEHLHSLTYGWTETIRAGVNQFLEILQELANINRDDLIAGTVKPPAFGFEIGSPPAVERFNNALAKFNCGD